MLCPTNGAKTEARNRQAMLPGCTPMHALAFPRVLLWWYECESKTHMDSHIKRGSVSRWGYKKSSLVLWLHGLQSFRPCALPPCFVAHHQRKRGGNLTNLSSLMPTEASDGPGLCGLRNAKTRLRHQGLSVSSIGENS